MRTPSRRPSLILLVAVAFSAAGCAAGNAYRQGRKEAEKGNYDLAVARLTKALELSPGNIKYKIALERARVEASQFHHKEARKHLAADELDRAAEELTIASNYDPGNQSAADDLKLVRERLRRRDEERRERAELEGLKERAQATRVPLPVLSPRSTVPITLRFAETTLDKVFETLSKVSGVNILYDEGFRADKRVPVNLTGVTFEEALDQITFVNRLFYKVVDANTIIIVPETPAKRRSYDELVVRTFYLQNAESKDLLATVKSISGITKATENAPLNAITLMGTPDQIALAARVIAANDKARGEVLVKVEILEVNRNNLKTYGIDLSNYEVSTTFSPTGASGEVAGGFTSVRAHLLSSLNVSDFVVNIPSTLFARFLQTDATVRILASPRLRAAEGKKTSLKIGTEVPIPVTTFTATQAGSTTFAPATSFQYRNVGVNLELTPKITATGEITLEIAAEFSLLGDDRNVGTGDNPIVVPTFLTRTVNGILRLRDGEPTLLGGLLQSSEAESFRGALGLQSIPVLNKIFAARTKRDDQSEVLISLTPHLVRAPKLTEEDFVSMLAGTQERVNVPGARPRLFGPEELPVAPPPSPSPSAPSAVPEPIPSPGGPEPPPAVPEAGAGAPPVAAGRLPTLAWGPQESTLDIGESVGVGLVAVGASGLLGVEVVVTYDPVVLEVLDVGPGTLLTLDGVALNIERNLEPGRLRARLTRPSTTSGSGAVVALRLRGLREGEATLTVESVVLNTEAGPVQPAPPAPARVTIEP
jgi:general secretion pathway protein D